MALLATKNFTITRAIQGPQGLMGPQGPQGPQGVPGVTGLSTVFTYIHGLNIHSTNAFESILPGKAISLRSVQSTSPADLITISTDKKTFYIKKTGWFLINISVLGSTDATQPVGYPNIAVGLYAVYPNPQLEPSRIIAGINGSSRGFDDFSTLAGSCIFHNPYTTTAYSLINNSSAGILRVAAHHNGYLWSSTYNAQCGLSMTFVYLSV